MNAYVIKDSTVVNIADAIREKLSISDTMTPLEMPNMIRQINGGGGGGGQVTYATLGLLNYPSNYKNFIFTNNTSVLPSNYLNQMGIYNCMTMEGNDLVFRIVDDTNFNCYIYTNSELKNIKFDKILDCEYITEPIPDDGDDPHKIATEEDIDKIIESIENDNASIATEDQINNLIKE